MSDSPSAPQNLRLFLPRKSCALSETRPSSSLPALAQSPLSAAASSPLGCGSLPVPCATAPPPGAAPATVRPALPIAAAIVRYRVPPTPAPAAPPSPSQSCDKLSPPAPQNHPPEPAPPTHPPPLKP